jgi:cytochrome c5
MNIRKFFIAFVTAPFFMIGCKTTKPAETAVNTPKAKADCGTQIPIYEADIKPIFEQHCNSCHGKRAAGGYDLRIMDDITRAANKGELLGVIKWENHYPQMPPRSAKLDDNTINKIECWIQTGMKQ